jgi:hypothetical protein
VIFREDFREWMEVEWRGELLRFARMSFGFTNAPGLFPLLIKEALRPLREIGIAVTSWIDDGLILAKTKKELLYIRDHILRPRLESLGWKINWDKSQ